MNLRSLIEQSTQVINTLGHRIYSHKISNPATVDSGCRILEDEYKKLEALNNYLSLIADLIDAGNYFFAENSPFVFWDDMEGGNELEKALQRIKDQ